MPGPATKLGSMTGHGGSVVGPGCPTVLINKVPAIRVGTDMHLCPMVTPGTPPIPHIGMTNIGPGVPTVLIGKMPASTVGDNFLCAGPPAPVVTGAFDVLIGTGGAGGGGGGGGGGAGAASTAQALKSGTISPVKGTETFPIEIQATLLECQPYMTPEAMDLQIKVIADACEAAGGVPQEEEQPMLTIADVVEILEEVEREEGYEAARFFSSHLEFPRLCDLTKAFIKGEDTNPENDPNQMPTRFMILYGADDSKLQQIDDHPDCADGEDYKLNVEYLRKSLISAGYEIAETGPYDDEVYMAHVRYQAGEMQGVSFEYDEEPSEDGTQKQTSHLKVSLEINPKAKSAQDDVYTLFSTDDAKTYVQSKTVKDDADKRNNTLDLVFTDLDTSLAYTLEVDPGAQGKTYVIFKNRPFGEW